MKNQCVEFMATRKSFFGLFLVTVLMIAGVNVARAQVTSSMSGRIDDSSGAAIPGARITVTSLETAIEHSATADEEGSYRVLSLPVGRYQIKAEKGGFKAAVQ